MAEDEMVREAQHHQLNGHEFEQTLGDNGGQRNLECYCPRGCRVSYAISPSHPLLPSSPFAFNPSSIRVFSHELAPHVRWPKYWSFSFSISPSSEFSGLISFDCFDLLAVQALPLTGSMSK